MFYDFKPTKGKPGEASSDPLAASMARRLLRYQRRGADHLGCLFEKLPTAWIKVGGVGVALTAGAYSTYLLATGLYSRENIPLTPSLAQVHTWLGIPFGLPPVEPRRQTDSLAREAVADSLPPRPPFSFSTLPTPPKPWKP
ncbi:hypothetical protein GCM10027275_42940 [Rhabdobacter roseus]|uniref:Uncharacterized protein n=1 Tax=Rhabdobacter roseus TaxID=1655419 RepID=A0A840TYG1_9BACT|nr:hypothetical protein [Rhabdobacter roseus]MBB5286652.1 hypothetical protein [Rhabdobacter roseus]